MRDCLADGGPNTISERSAETGHGPRDHHFDTIRIPTDSATTTGHPAWRATPADYIRSFDAPHVGDLSAGSLPPSR